VSSSHIKRGDTGGKSGQRFACAGSRNNCGVPREGQLVKRPQKRKESGRDPHENCNTMEGPEGMGKYFREGSRLKGLSAGKICNEERLDLGRRKAMQEDL